MLHLLGGARRDAPFLGLGEAALAVEMLRRDAADIRLHVIDPRLALRAQLRLKLWRCVGGGGWGVNKKNKKQL